MAAPPTLDQKADLGFFYMDEIAVPLNKTVQGMISSGKLTKPKDDLNDGVFNEENMQLVGKDDSQCKAATIQVGDPNGDPQALYAPDVRWAQCFSGYCEVSSQKMGSACLHLGKNAMDRVREILGVPKPATAPIKPDTEPAVVKPVSPKPVIAAEPTEEKLSPKETAMKLFNAVKDDITSEKNGDTIIAYIRERVMAGDSFEIALPKVKAKMAELEGATVRELEKVEKDAKRRLKESKRPGRTPDDIEKDADRAIDEINRALSK